MLLVVASDNSNRKLHRDLKHDALQVLRRERVHCANAFRMGSSNSFTTKSLRMLIYRIPKKGSPPDLLTVAAQIDYDAKLCQQLCVRNSSVAQSLLDFMTSHLFLKCDVV